MNKLISFLLIIIIASVLLFLNQNKKKPEKSPRSGFSISIEPNPTQMKVTAARRTQLKKMAKTERSKIKVQVEHDNSPFTDSYPMILDATGSYDPDLGDQIYFKWRQLSGPIVSLKPDNFSSKVSFIGTQGDYEFELTVSDDYGAENTVIKSVIIEAEGNLPPVIDMKIRQGSELN